MRLVLLLIVGGVAPACEGGGPAVPSTMPAPPPATVAAPPALPVGLDPAYVRALTYASPSGFVRRWEGGPFRHCVGPDVDAALVREAAAAMSAATGIPEAEKDAPCNVTWERDRSVGHIFTSISGTDVAIMSARVVFRGAPNPEPRYAVHEAGHVIGLLHSPVAEDVMYFGPTRDAFSRDERAVLAWMYARR